MAGPLNPRCVNKIFSLKVLLLQLISTLVDTPDSLFTIWPNSPERVNGTRPACKSVTVREKSLAKSYPNPLPPNVGIDSPPVAITRDLQVT